MNINIQKSIKDIESSNMKNFKIAMENKDFAFVAYKLDMDESVLCKYTTKIENTVSELNNCKKCKGLSGCLNSVTGCVNYPKKEGEYLVFSYVPCKYQKEKIKNESKVIFYETPSALKEAKLSEIYTNEKSREKILIYIKDFLKNYPNKKGVYLYGSFGSGKSYIINAILNELSKKNITCVSVYFPTLLKKLKDSFNGKTGLYEQTFNELENADVLLIDDIGAENNTAWSRDEVLSTLLQSRMDEKKITFFTSNFTLEELEHHLSETKDSTELIKARRIIERIKQLSTPIELIGENKRK